MKKVNFIFRFCLNLMVIMQKLRTLRGLTSPPNVQNEDVHFLQISYRLQVLNLNVLWKHNICRCSLAMDINFERGRKTNNMIQTHEAKIFSESKYELNKRDVFHSRCKWENHPIKTSQTLYHDESSLSGQFIWVTPHCEHQPWSPYHSPSGQHCPCLQTWSKKISSKKSGQTFIHKICRLEDDFSCKTQMSKWPGAETPNILDFLSLGFVLNFDPSVIGKKIKIWIWISSTKQPIFGWNSPALLCACNKGTSFMGLTTLANFQFWQIRPWGPVLLYWYFLYLQVHNNMI